MLNCVWLFALDNIIIPLLTLDSGCIICYQAGKDQSSPLYSYFLSSLVLFYTYCIFLISSAYLTSSCISCYQVIQNNVCLFVKQSSSMLLLLFHLRGHLSLKNQHSHHLSPTLWPQASSQFTTERYADFCPSCITQMCTSTTVIYSFKHLIPLFLKKICQK